MSSTNGFFGVPEFHVGPGVESSRRSRATDLNGYRAADIRARVAADIERRETVAREAAAHEAEIASVWDEAHLEHAERAQRMGEVLVSSETAA